MSEDMNQNNQQPVEQQPSQPAQPEAPQPAAPQQPPAPTGAPVVPATPQVASQQPGDQQPGGQQQPEAPQEEKSKVTFRDNGKYSFWATDEDPESDSKPMSWGFKIGWFMLGFVGGMLGLVMAWLSTSTLSRKRRNQAIMATWVGFAVQAVLFLVIVLTGGTFPPFMPFAGGANSASTATTTTSAFG